MAIADFGGGVQEAIAELIKDRLDREETARKAETDRQRMALSERSTRLQEQQHERISANDQRVSDEARKRQEFLDSLLSDPASPQPTGPSNATPGGSPLPNGGHIRTGNSSRLAEMVRTPEGRAALMTRGGISDPDSLLPPEQEKPKLYPVTVPGPDGRPVQKLVTEEELRTGVAPYREPRQPTQAPAPNEIDLGDRVILVDRSGRTVAEYPKGGGIDQKAINEANEIQDSIDLIDQIANDPALPASVGFFDARGGLGKMRDPDGVTRFEGLHNQLVGRMQLALAGKLRGQGQISDKERAMLMAAATALTRTLGEGDYKKELAKVRTQFERMPRLGAVIGGQTQVDRNTFGNIDVPGGGQTFSVTAPDGQRYSFPSQAALDNFKRAAGIR